MKVAAGIVLYNPDLERLKKNIDAILPQVDLLILIDNASSNLNCVRSKYHKNSYIKIIENQSNLGVAYALNQIVKISLDLEYEWTLLLDQDSICAENLIEEYQNYSTMKDVVLITPNIIDLNKQVNDYVIKNDKPNYVMINRAITSGSLIKTVTWEKLGPFENKYFIDKVDTEYSMRIHVNKLKQIRCQNTYILHEIGKAERTIFYFMYRMWPNPHTCAWAFRSNHSYIRIFYRSRNSILFMKKYQNDLNLFLSILKILYDAFRQIIIEKDKYHVIKGILKGIIEGVSTKVEVYKYILDDNMNKNGGIK